MNPRGYIFIKDYTRNIQLWKIKNFLYIIWFYKIFILCGYPGERRRMLMHYILRASFTTKDGKKVYARDYGKKAFKIPVGSKTKPMKK